MKNNMPTNYLKVFLPQILVIPRLDFKENIILELQDSYWTVNAYVLLIQNSENY